MESTEKFFTRLVHVLALAAGWSLLAIGIVITFSALARKLFGISLQGIDEYAGYILAAFSAVGFSQALLQRGHIRIDIVRDRLSRPGRVAIDIAAHLTILFASVFLAVSAIGVARDSAALQAVSVGPMQTPLVIPQTIWAAMLSVFAALCIFLTARLAMAVSKRDWTLVEKKFGMRSVQEEVSDELVALQERKNRTSAP